MSPNRLCVGVRYNDVTCITKELTNFSEHIFLASSNAGTATCPTFCRLASSAMSQSEQKLSRQQFTAGYVQVARH